MATSRSVSRRLDRDFVSIEGFLTDLPALAEEWDRLDDGAQTVLSLDWDHLIADYLTELDSEYRSDGMPSDHAARYRSLLAKLKATMPIITRLNLYRPPVSLDP